MENREEKETKKTWLKPTEILPCVIIILGVIAAIVAFNIGGRDNCRQDYIVGNAKTEAMVVQTVLMAGMYDNSVDSITAGTVTPSDNNKTVYYPGGSFQMETYMHMPSGEWHWNADGIVDKGCYERSGDCVVYSGDNWTCTRGLSCSNCTCN